MAKRAKWLVISVSILFWGCKEDVGIELPPDVQRTEVKYAEFTLPVTNVYFDSLRTDSRGVAFLGEYSDEVYGSISSKVFTEYRFKSGDIVDEMTVDKGDFNETIEDITFEKAQLFLDITDALSSTNSIALQVEISTLADSIFAEGLYLRDSEILKNELIQSSTVNFDEIDTVDFTNQAEHLVTIDLSTEYSNYILSTFEEDSAAMRPLGFVIEPNSGSGLLSIDMTNPSTEIGLLMRGRLIDTLGVYKKDTLFTAVTFTLSSSASNYFTKIDRDRSTSLFASSADKMEIEPVGDFVYLNTLAGLFPRIDLSPFIEFSESESGILFNRVTLEIAVEENPSFIPHQGFSQFYFSYDRQDKVVINWPSTLPYPSFLGTDYLGTIMQRDVRYLGLRSDFSPAIFTNQTLSEDGGPRAFVGNEVVFWQSVYENSQDDLKGIKIENRPLIRAFLVGVDNLVMVPGQALPLGRNSINKESIKLKVFYTQLKD
ncbi:MAG: DUF4270 family protein [Cyclobacteriaceae bacterium]